MRPTQNSILRHGDAAASAFSNWVLERALSRIVTRGCLGVTASNGQQLSFGDGSGERVHVSFAAISAQWAFLMDADLRLGELYMDHRFLIEMGSLHDFLAMMLREAQNARHPLIARLTDRARTWLRIFRHRNLPARSKQMSPTITIWMAGFTDSSSTRTGNIPAPISKAPTSRSMRRSAPRSGISPRNCSLGLARPCSISVAAGVGWPCIWPGMCRAGMCSASPCRRSSMATRSSGLPNTSGWRRGIQFALQDYRSLSGRFDRIVSVGMFEHVGLASYRTFFEKCADLLEDEGIMLLHTIDCSATPGFNTPWLDKYIFPGGYIPALLEILPEIEKAGLAVTDIEVLRLHYAWTLAHWRKRFMER